MSSNRDLLQQEIASEQAHVDRVYDQLMHATNTAKGLVAQGRELFVTDRDNFVREEDGTALFERDAFAYQAARRLAVLDAEHEGLVFGRLDLTDPDTRYIGRLGVRSDDYEPLVIDWRAPAAEPFYRATQANPMQVIRRRVLRCRDDQVIGIEDDLLDGEAESDLPIFGEGALLASLNRARGLQMRDIVATIQAEQDEAIRAPYQGVTIIGGGPGTGKTVVALHRAAYLLYTYRARLERGGVLVVGPSSVFMNYIERVLPSLGEESVTLRSVGAVATDVLGFSSERVDDATAATVKGSLRMHKLLRRLVREPLVAGELQARVSVKGEVLTVGHKELGKIRDAVLAHTPMNKGRAQAFELVVDALLAKLPGDVDIERDQARDQISDHANLAMFMNAWWPMLEPEQVLTRLQDPELLGRLSKELTATERAALVDSYQWLSDEPTLGWSVADIALLDDLHAMLGPVPEAEDPDPTVFIDLADDEVPELVSTADLLRFDREIDDEHPTFAHVLVDESQDITPMQWRMLRRRGPQASWTLVGDPAQSSYPMAEETEAAIDALVGKSQLRRFTLSTNYRSPKEVFDLAAQVISTAYPGADLPEAVRETGVPPELVDTDEVGLAETLRRSVLKLADAVEGTLAVIAPPSRMAAVEDVLQDPALAHLSQRLVTVSPLQAKGLEYDAVVVLCPDEIVSETPGGIRVLYVALTRATQREIIVDVGSTHWRDLLR